MGEAALSFPAYDEVRDRAEAAGLIVMGVVPEAAPIVLLGAGPGFWTALRASPEGADDLPDPVDRWSLRVIADLAAELGAAPRFPFGGPPYEPFIAWAKASGRAWRTAAMRPCPTMVWGSRPRPVSLSSSATSSWRHSTSLME